MELMLELVLRPLYLLMVALLASGGGKDRLLFVPFSVILLSVTSQLSPPASLGHALTRGSVVELERMSRETSIPSSPHLFPYIWEIDENDG